MIRELYFPLENNIMYSEEMACLTDKYGAEGFGIYMLLLIEFRNFNHYRMSETSVGIVMRRHMVNKKKLNSVLNDFGLFDRFERNGTTYYSSPYMDRVMQPLENYRKKHFSEKKKPATTQKRGANGRFTAKDKPTVTVEPADHGTFTVKSPAVKKNTVEEKRKEKTTTVVVEKRSATAKENAAVMEKTIRC